MKNTRGGEPVGRGRQPPVRQLACTALRSSFRDGSLNLFVWHTHVKAPVRTGRVACVHSIVHSPGEFREAEPFRDKAFRTGRPEILTKRYHIFLERFQF